jgi:hypothetical protein
LNVKKSTRYIIAGLLAAVWATALVAIKIILPPSLGAVVVQQLNASDTSYWASLGMAIGARQAAFIVTLVFAFLVISVLRSK